MHITFNFGLRVVNMQEIAGKSIKKYYIINSSTCLSELKSYKFFCSQQMSSIFMAFPLLCRRLTEWNAMQEVLLTIKAHQYFVWPEFLPIFSKR